MTAQPTDKNPAPRRRRPHQTSIWTTRLESAAPYVRLHPSDEDKLRLWMPQDEPSEDGQTWGFLHAISRRDARLLAKRINECLDATVLR